MIIYMRAAMLCLDEQSEREIDTTSSSCMISLIVIWVIYLTSPDSSLAYIFAGTVQHFVDSIGIYIEG
jgi:hypothetical protein